MWIERDIEPRLGRAFRQRPVVVLTGARQTGKTSLVRHAFPALKVVSLDLPAQAAEATESPAQFLNRHPAPLAIDEVQYAGALFRHLKAVVDADRDRNGQYLLTGSQSFTLMKGVSDSLAGRVALLELDPLSIAEIRRAHPALPIEALIRRGGYPELHAKLDLEPGEFYRDYAATYLERDVRSLLNVGSLRDFERFLRACALRSAQVLNRSDLARDVGVAPSTAGQWLSVLEASRQIVLLEPWFSNRTKTLTKSPKLYVADTGLLCFLLDIRTDEDLLRSPQRGPIWETFVFAELRKQLALDPRGGSLHFLRDRTREVDFVVHRGGRFDLAEAKWTESPTARDAEGLLYAASCLGEDVVASARVICRPAAPHAIPGVRAIGRVRVRAESIDAAAGG